MNIQEKLLALNHFTEALIKYNRLKKDSIYENVDIKVITYEDEESIILTSKDFSVKESLVITLEEVYESYKKNELIISSPIYKRLVFFSIDNYWGDRKTVVDMLDSIMDNPKVIHGYTLQLQSKKILRRSDIGTIYFFYLTSNIPLVQEYITMTCKEDKLVVTHKGTIIYEGKYGDSYFEEELYEGLRNYVNQLKENIETSNN